MLVPLRRLAVTLSLLGNVARVGRFDAIRSAVGEAGSAPERGDVGAPYERDSSVYPRESHGGVQKMGPPDFLVAEQSLPLDRRGAIPGSFHGTKIRMDGAPWRAPAASVFYFLWRKVRNGATV